MTATTARESNESIFTTTQAYTFDDVVIVPAFSSTLPDAVDVSAVFSRDIRLASPLISAAMDRVTESKMAIAMARSGGLGVIHRNMSIAEQSQQVVRVKRSQSGWITDPVTLSISATLQDAEDIMSQFHISGVPIVDAERKLVGILTNRDTRFCEAQDFSRSVADFMTVAPLITAPMGTTLAQARTILGKHRLEKLPLVDSDGTLMGLITVKDILKATEHPNATQDDRGRLRCGAAVGVGADLEERVSALVKAGVDAVCIDTAHGHSLGVLNAIRRIRSDWPDLAIVAGNVVTAEGVEALVEAGADTIKVGVGAGSICTTRVVSGAGLPQLSAIWEAARAADRLNIPIIGDGGVAYSGDIVKAIAAGASTVMIGSMLAGADESPGEVELFEGRRYKSYRGMGSLGAMSGYSADRYGSGQSTVESQSERSGKIAPEGIEGRVPATGSVLDVIAQMLGGLRSGMGYAGAASIAELQTSARFRIVTAAGRAESHPHDVTITKEAPNYQRSSH
ncbi:MAG: IMP dehydrogenase [Actinobacteria bacterium]|nr:IMP dehydrogenase [Actinomycetota bacterium]